MVRNLDSKINKLIIILLEHWSFEHSLTFGIVETKVLHAQTHGPMNQLGQVLVLHLVLAEDHSQMVRVLLQLCLVALQGLHWGDGGASATAQECVQPRLEYLHGHGDQFQGDGHVVDEHPVESVQGAQDEAGAGGRLLLQLSLCGSSRGLDTHGVSLVAPPLVCGVL